MAEVTKRRAGELVRGVFEILMQAPEGMPAKEVLQKLVERVPPSEFESTYYPDRPNERRYEKIVRFYTIHSVKAGWLVKDKGQWSLIDDGLAAYHRFSDPAEFRDEAVRQYREWKRQRDAQSSSDEPRCRRGGRRAAGPGDSSSPRLPPSRHVGQMVSGRVLNVLLIHACGTVSTSYRLAYGDCSMAV